MGTGRSGRRVSAAALHASCRRARRWGRHAAWDDNFEAVAPFGDFAGDDLRAWTFASDTGYTWVERPWRPRFGPKANIASGDRDLACSALQTFNALFPRGAYFSERALIGPANFIDPHPSVMVEPTAAVSVTLDCDFFWRESGSGDDVGYASAWVTIEF